MYVTREAGLTKRELEVDGRKTSREFGVGFVVEESTRRSLVGGSVLTRGGATMAAPRLTAFTRVRN